jgi:hypothetical protein
VNDFVLVEAIELNPYIVNSSISDQRDGKALPYREFPPRLD